MTDDESIPRQRKRRFFQTDLSECRVARLQAVLPQQDDITHQLGSSNVETDALSHLNWIRCRAEKLEVAIEHRSRSEQTRRRQDHASLNLRHFDALEVQRSTLSGERLISSVAMDLNTANACRPLCGKDLDFLFLCHFAGYESSGSDRSEALHCETAVDRQAKNVARVFRPRFSNELPQCFDELRNALACVRADPQNWRGFEEAAFQKLPNLHFDEIGHVGVDVVDFCEYREPLLDMKQGADVQVLPGLRHHGFIGSDDEHHQINPADTRKHVLDESFMAGNVDEANRCIGIQGEMRKTDIDRNATFLLFFQAIGVNSRERFNQRGFAMVDMSCSSYDNVRHKSSCTKGSGSPMTLK